MKIILSRKGFDTANGGIPSPIFPNGTMLSMPIPCSSDPVTFYDLQYGDSTYADILKQLAPKNTYSNCHLDPDIRKAIRKNPIPNWKPAFGQIGAAQSYLKNNKIQPGDLFLFFGRFQKTTGNAADGTLSFDKKSPIVHVIYGYMEIGEIISYDKIAEKNYTWHPHGCGERLSNKTNTLYIPSETLSFDKASAGWGTFDYSPTLVLTLSNKTATWKEIPAIMPDNISSERKNSAAGEGIFYKGIWQELVLKENSLSEKWAKSLFNAE